MSMMKQHLYELSVKLGYEGAITDEFLAEINDKSGPDPEDENEAVEMEAKISDYENGSLTARPW